MPEAESTPEPPDFGPRQTAVVLVALALAWSGIAVLDPARSSGIVFGPVMAGLGSWLARRSRRASPVLDVGVLLALAFATSALFGPRLRADGPSYYAFLRSLFFDRDLDCTNEWAQWGFPALPLSPTGLRQSVYAIGPALLWSPFFHLAHAYVLLGRPLGLHAYPADGYSAPYVGATALGTATVAVIGCCLCASALSRRVGSTCARLAVAGAILTSPALYYVFPGASMAHGLVVGVAAFGVWAAERVSREPSERNWILLGAATGVLAMVRWQAIVYALFPICLGLWGLLRRTSRMAWLLAGAAASLAAFLPQMLAWQAIYGRPIWLPGSELHVRGWDRWFDAASPRFFDVLIHADRGLFAWTPVMAVATLGLLLSLKRWGILAFGGILVFVSTAWLNGSLSDWSGSDAFGARRFDLVIPFLALGLATVLSGLLKRPWTVIAAGIGMATLWNVGLIRMHESGAVTEAAPLERIAALEARLLRGSAERGLERLFGDRGRALAYEYFVGEYFYWNLNLSGTLDLGTGSDRYLSGGWSPPQNRNGPAEFRFAHYPKACVRFPLERPTQDLRVLITARAPARLSSQVMTTVLNGKPIGSAPLTSEWSDVSGVLAQRALVAGENLLCLEFAEGLPGEGEERVAAAVRRIQLP